MFKKCRYCKYCYCGDESDVSGFDCAIIRTLKIIDLDKVHEYCDNYKFSFWKLLLGV